MQIRRPSDDEQRVQTLHALNILDQQPDPQFMDITKLVATIFRVSRLPCLAAQPLCCGCS